MMRDARCLICERLLVYQLRDVFVFGLISHLHGVSPLITDEQVSLTRISRICRISQPLR